MCYVTHLVPPLSTLSLLLLLTFTFTFCIHSTNATKKNILFIIVDDLRPALGCYYDSFAITPNIDRIAEQSVQFQHAYSQVTTTKQTHLI